MNLIRRAATQLCKRGLFSLLACVCALPVAAQPSTQPSTQSSTQPAAIGSAPDPTAASAPAPAALDGIVNLDGPWRFQIGDDPRWADPVFDASSWHTLSLSQPVNAQGIPPYSGYAWYRLRVSPPPASLPLDLLVVGDVSGKGLQAAMNSSTLVGALCNETSYDPATILRHLNRVLIGAVATPGKVPELDAAPSFATCLCARIYADGAVTIANAGHLSPYRDGRELELLPGLPLGVIPNAEYEQSTFQLNRGDRLVFLSDGVVEAANAEGELFGFDRTRQVSHESARYIASTAQRFGQTDDITVVSIYVASRAASHTSEPALHSN